MGHAKSAGFAVGIYSQAIIEENARDKVHEFGQRGVSKFVTKQGAITDAGWEQLNRDIRSIERNALRWLRKTFVDARDEGHGSDDDLIGTVWYDPNNADQMELLELASDAGRSERVDMVDASFGDFAETAFDGVSDFGASVLGGAIVFFDVDEEF